LIELNLIVGANFALSWVRKRHPQLNFNTISQGIPPQRLRMVLMQAHMDTTIEPARRIIAWLLEADTQLFRERHYLDPLLAGPVDQWCVSLCFVINSFVLYYIFGVRVMLLIWCLCGCTRFWVQDAFLCGLPHLCACQSLCVCRSRTFDAVYIFEIEPLGVSIFELKVRKTCLLFMRWM
jgi:hypothetical protein